MYQVQKPKEKEKMKLKPYKRNELHFQNCLRAGVAYVSKNKKKAIPRKRKYKEREEY